MTSQSTRTSADALKWTGEFYLPGRSPRRIAEDHEARYAFAGRFVKGEKVLDIACGVGYGSRELLKAGASSVTGVDINRDIVQYACANYGACGIDFGVGDICNFREGRYGVITCFETIEHVSDYKSALKSLYHVLDDDGLLIISSPNRMVTSPNAKSDEDIPSNPYHRHEFTIREFAEELRTYGFVIRKGEILGQRGRIVFNIPLIDTIYGRLFSPDENSDPSVRVLTWQEIPRYFVVIAHKV